MPSTLTRKNLRLLDQTGKRGQSVGSVTPPPSPSTHDSASTTATGFALQAEKNGILPIPRSRPPDNIEDIRQRYGASRASASPTPSLYEYYADAVETAPNETTLLGLSPFLSTSTLRAAGPAEVTTFTTDGATLNIFAHHATRAPDGRVQYHQCRVWSTSLVDSFESFRQGRRGLRNLQDHAREQSRALRDALREHWNKEEQRRVALCAQYEAEVEAEVKNQGDRVPKKPSIKEPRKPSNRRGKRSREGAVKTAKRPQPGPAPTRRSARLRRKDTI